MVGMATAQTLDHIKMSPDSAAYFKDIFDEDGNPVVLDEVYISNVSSAAPEGEHGRLGPEWGARGRGPRIGPEYAFGLYMHQALDEPILLIKTAWGGKSLSFDFRPPSAEQWTPPAGHPDLVQAPEPEALPIPDQIDIAKGYVPPEEILPRYTTGRIGKYLGLSKMRGVAIGKQVAGVHPIYIATSPRQEFEGNPFRAGDLLLGINGSGLRADAIDHWRQEFHGDKSEDWMISVTRWRDGKIETFKFDIAQTLPDGRAGIAKYKQDQKQQKIDRQKYKGHYYRLMMEHIEKVLGDIKAVYPDYDADRGYKIAGFVWFQGWNDLVDGNTYPNRDQPRGYEQYTWLLEHLIRDVRKDLDAPDMPFVIGVLGVDGVLANPVGSNMHHFRSAMAAPADNPEFAGTVAAVYSEKYWPDRLAKLAQRDRVVQQYRNMLRMRDGLEGEELQKAYDAYRAQYFTPEEEAILKTGKSNQGYHYLGSGKFMAGLGRAFADEMLKMHNPDQ